VEFPTIQFTYFCLIAVTIYWLLHRTRTTQKSFLLLASYFFAWKFQPLFLVTLIASTLMNWLFGKSLVELEKEKHPRRKTVLVAGLLANLGILAYFKYYDFFIENLGAFLSFVGLEAHLPLLELIAPFGISFYTFQAMAYLVDTYRGKAVQPASLLDFSLFMAFFPKFGAGPIVRSQQLLPQLAEPAPREIPALSRAIAMIATGLLKKMVIASYLAEHLTTDAFLSPQAYSSLELVLAVFAYTAQVYLDFSGYTDIARGVALLFGIELPENFNYPYRATDIGDFWRRWHMTFSSWLREYIYFPLGGSKGARWRTYFNLMVTFVACGIWHGASWGFIIWGALHGIGLSVYKASLDIRRDMGVDTDAPRPFWVIAGGWFLTLNFCAFVRIFFKTTDVSTALDYFGGIFSFTTRGTGFDLGVLFLTIFTIAMNFYGRPIFDAFVRWHEGIPNFVRPVAWVGIMLALFTLKPFGMAATLYFSF
jgi:D-alanyl-lipoteichoic acid acyltransferase DltB (MBOAT superfamily)